jgi:hypothetical protein
MHDTCIKNSKSKCRAIFEISHTNPPTTPIQLHTWKLISNVGWWAIQVWSVFPPSHFASQATTYLVFKNSHHKYNIKNPPIVRMVCTMYLSICAFHDSNDAHGLNSQKMNPKTK